MAFLFGRGRKSPQDLIKSLRSGINSLTSEDESCKATAKAQEKISTTLSYMKYMLYGDGDNDPKPENIEKLVQELLDGDVLPLLLQRIISFEFEARKEVAMIFNFLLRRGKHNLTVRYVQSHPDLLKVLVEGYRDKDTALHCGSILRECIRHEELNAILLESQLFAYFFEFVQDPQFEVASDAFATFKAMLSKHKDQAAEFLQSQYESVFSKYNLLIQSQNYVTKRQSLKLLGEILLDRKNYNVMMKYIHEAENLKLLMKLLNDSKPTIQFEAFHVFKVFVANPNKSEPVLRILLRNKAKLIDFLKDFQKNKEDEQFAEEKKLLIRTLEQLE